MEGAVADAYNGGVFLHARAQLLYNNTFHRFNPLFTKATNIFMNPFAVLRGVFWWSRLPVQRLCRTAHSLWRALGFGMISFRSCASSLDYRAYTDTFLGHLKTYLFVRAGVWSASE